MIPQMPASYHICGQGNGPGAPLRPEEQEPPVRRGLPSAPYEKVRQCRNEMVKLQGVIPSIHRGEEDVWLTQIKSRQRVADHGEVFTGEREVRAMCDLVSDECLRIDSRFLEPACGDGNFLAEILQRKLAVVKEKYRRSPYDWERNSLLALGSLYGVDILADNCAHCRSRLYKIWERAYRSVCRRECSDDTRRAARFVLERNIVCGNARTLRCVDEAQQDTKVPIVFSEWTFPQNNAFLHRKDYTFAELLDEEAPGAAARNSDGEGTFVQEYVCHYRRLGEAEPAGQET